MNWFFIALGAPFLWAIVNVADQYLVKKAEDEDSPIGSLVIFSSIIGLIISFFIIIISKDALLIPAKDSILLFAAGVINIVWIVFYLYALSYEDVSTVYPWFLTVPIFSYLLGDMFLGEKLTHIQEIGMLIVIFGGLMISLDPKELMTGKVKFKIKASLCMIFSAFLVSVQQVMFKFVTVPDTFWGSSFWQYLGLGFSGIFIFLFIKKYRKGFISIVKTSGKKILAINVVSELITIAGNTLFQFSLLLAPVALVSLMEPIQAVILFVITIIGSIFFPKIIKEDISKQTIIYKVISIAVMILGSSLFLL